MKSSLKPSQGSVLLCAWIASTGTTYTKLAADLGVNANTVYCWLRGSGRPRVEMWPQIEQVTAGAVPPLAWTQPMKAV